MKKNTIRSLKLAILAISTVALFSTTTLAASWDAGDWKLSLGGNINAFYVETWASNGSLDANGLTLTKLTAVNGTNKDGNVTNTGSVSNGLLPASLNFSASTNQAGWDISANVNVYYGIDSAGANGDQVGVLGDGDGNIGTGSDALKFSTVDARQVYMTFGRKDLGTFKLGRDFGIFAFDAIINDMTLLSVGAPFLVGDPGHTTLGGLGYGYVYTDRLAQMDYTTPNWAGFQGTVGVFQGFDGNGANSADTPGFQGKVSYTMDGPVKLYGSVSGLIQKVVTYAGTNDQILGVDGCVKAGVAGFNFLGYYYYAQGMTSLAIGGLVFPGFQYATTTDQFGHAVLDKANSTGKAEETDGYMLQGMYTMGKVRFGVNWAQSWQTQLTKVRNDKLTLGVYYNLTPALQLVAEYSHMQSKLKADNSKDTAQAADIGAILFF
jgi:hypothetical protein